jgi:hypothetical protein
MKTSFALFCLLPIAFVSSSAGAVDIYKYVLPNGSVLYSQTTIKHRKPVKIVHVEPLTPTQRQAQKTAQQQLRQLQVRSDQLAMQLAAQQIVDNSVPPVAPAAVPEQVASEILVPLPGERIANVNGFSRLTEAYWQRVRRELGPNYPGLQVSSAGQ